MNIFGLLSYGAKSVLSDRKRSLWVIIGLAVGIGLYVAITTIANGYSKLVALPFTQLKTDIIVQRATKGGQKSSPLQNNIRIPFSNQPISGSELELISKINGIKNINEAIILWHQTKNKFTTIVGINPFASTGPSQVLSWLKKGRILKNTHEVIVESHYAKFNKINIGDPLTIGNQEFMVVGLASIKEGASIAAANLYISLKDARNLAQMENHSANMLFIKLKKGLVPSEIQNKLSSAIPGILSSTGDNIGSMLKGFAKISNYVSRILAIVSLGFAITLSSWLVAGSLNERDWHIAIMKTTGWIKKEILIVLTSEMITIGAIGGLCGIILGYIVSIFVGNIEIGIVLPWNLSMQTKMSVEVAGQNASIPVTMELKTILTALALSIASTSITGITIVKKLTNTGVNYIFRQSLNQ